MSNNEATAWRGHSIHFLLRVSAQAARKIEGAARASGRVPAGCRGCDLGVIEPQRVPRYSTDTYKANWPSYQRGPFFCYSYDTHKLRRSACPHGFADGRGEMAVGCRQSNMDFHARVAAAEKSAPDRQRGPFSSGLWCLYRNWTHIACTSHLRVMPCDSRGADFAWVRRRSMRKGAVQHLRPIIARGMHGEKQTHSQPMAYARSPLAKKVGTRRPYTSTRWPRRLQASSGPPLAHRSRQLFNR